jgi:site-specific DNA recombinase
MGRRHRRIRTQQPARCQSTEQGLDKEFTSLDAQRESAEACVKSQAGLGWVCLPTRYDDGGFTGRLLELTAILAVLDEAGEENIAGISDLRPPLLSGALAEIWPNAHL